MTVKFKCFVINPDDCANIVTSKLPQLTVLGVVNCKVQFVRIMVDSRLAAAVGELADRVHRPVLQLGKSKTGHCHMQASKGQAVKRISNDHGTKMNVKSHVRQKQLAKGQLVCGGSNCKIQSR